MNPIDFFLGMAACAVIVGVWRVIKEKKAQDLKQATVRRKHSHEHIEFRTEMFTFRGDIAELFERLERLEKRRK